MIKSIILFFIFLSTTSFSAVDPTVCERDIGKLPTLSGGRIKPILVTAEETMRFLTHNKTPLGVSRTEAFCRLSLESQGNTVESPIHIIVDHVEAKMLLHLSVDAKSIEAEKLIAEEQNLKATYFSIKENNSFKKELNKILLRIQVYQQLTEGKLWTVAVNDNSEVKWIPIADLESVDLESSLFNQPEIIKGEPQLTYEIEYTYFRLHLFGYAIAAVLLAIFCIVIFKKNTLGFIVAGLAIAIQIVGISLRIYISGRAPITNMYETVMFSGFGALIISTFLTYFKKDKIFILGGLSYNMLCLLMMTFANNMLDPAIKPLVPVLRDNFWLSTHVTTVILSYAALALSWILANITLAKRAFLKADASEIKRQSRIIYICVQVGVVMLSAGIILGGVWADYSWGRFWGWDPKETWSLIVLLIYVAILHGKYSSWINDRNFVPLIALAFLSVMMAWFGVNYILATGLHSYGFSEGGAIFLGSFFIAQIGFLILSLLKIKNIKS
ncbi:MAG: cytochrome c biogenesis protein CcsA [Halobacteriovoraceae bacterium]|nr:cytochrome c biogenesis protein CcsA [Halobacteriovoraceae bacterium]